MEGGGASCLPGGRGRGRLSYDGRGRGKLSSRWKGEGQTVSRWKGEGQNIIKGKPPKSKMGLHNCVLAKRCEPLVYTLY